MDNPQNTSPDPSPEPHRTHRTANPGTLWGKLVSFITPANKSPQKTIKSRDHLWSILIGVGLALFPIHNEWLTQLVMSNGEVGFFLPAFGTALWLMGSLAFVTWNWERIRATGLGDKRVWIPLLVIVGAIGLSGIPADRWQDKISPFLMGISLFALYVSARVLGKAMFLPLAIGAGIASLGVIAYGIAFPGSVTGGFVFEQNYDIVVGFVLLGTALFAHRYQWILASLALVAMFLTGSPEGVFVTGVLGAVVIARRDWGKRLVFAMMPLVLVIGLWFGLGYGQTLYGYVTQVATGKPTMSEPVTHAPDYIHTTATTPDETADIENNSALGYRLVVIKHALTNIRPLGEGYNLTEFSKSPNVHNVPLVIVQQLGWPGILAGLAWLWVAIWCLVKTKWKYAWVLILSLSVFDHFIFTQLGPWFWAIAGASTVGGIKSDLIFKTKRIAENEVYDRYGRIVRQLKETL